MSIYITTGTRRISLKGNEILFEREELICYHKRDYGYEPYQKIILKSEADANYIFNEMRDLYMHGKQAGEENAETAIREKLRVATQKIFNEGE